MAIDVAAGIKAQLGELLFANVCLLAEQQDLKAKLADMLAKVAELEAKLK